MSFLRELVRHARANAIAYVALFAALGGTAYAADTIGSSDIINESILSQDIKNGEVMTSDLGGKVPSTSVFSMVAEPTSSGTDRFLHAGNEIFDTANLHDSASTTQSLVAPLRGTYAISATVEWDPKSGGYRRTSIEGPNGPLASTTGPALPAPSATSQNVSGIERLSAGQSVRVKVAQASGGNLNARLQRFEMTFVGP
jgi:hypothetical protein